MLEIERLTIYQNILQQIRRPTRQVVTDVEYSNPSYIGLRTVTDRARVQFVSDGEIVIPRYVIVQRVADITGMFYSINSPLQDYTAATGSSAGAGIAIGASVNNNLHIYDNGQFIRYIEVGLGFAQSSGFEVLVNPFVPNTESAFMVYGFI